MNLNIKINKLKFSYKEQNILIIDNYYIQGPGMFLICGESGSGKSTLLKLINGELKPQYGEISLSSHCIMLPQDIDIIGETAGELFSLISGKTIFDKDQIIENFNLDFLKEEGFAWDHIIGIKLESLVEGR